MRSQPFFELDIGLPVDELRTPVRACLDGGGDLQARVIAARNRKGQGIACRVLCTPLALDGAVDGVIMVMEEDGEPATAARRGRGVTG